MPIGIDVGGTNTDGAVVKDDEVITFKVPNELGIGEILKEIKNYTDLRKEKLVVSTSLPLNLLLSRAEDPTLTLLIPGPGLNYEPYGIILKGAVNHRGDVVEDIDEDEVIRILEENKGKFKNVAIACKFSIRNPILELKIAKIVSRYLGYENIALNSRAKLSVENKHNCYQCKD